MAEKHSVLIVDDDEFLLDMYSLRFRQSDFDVEIAFSGAEALEKIRGGLKPEIVIMDLVMPNIDGFELLDTIKKEKMLQSSSFIVLTNLGQKEHIERGMKIGADDYIIKAYFTPTEVVKKVTALLEKKKNG